MPLPGRVGASVTQEATPWASLFTGLAVSRRRCRAKGTMKALGCVVHVFSCRDGAGRGGRWKQV